MASFLKSLVSALPYLVELIRFGKEVVKMFKDTPREELSELRGIVKDINKASSKEQRVKNANEVRRFISKRIGR